MATHSLTRNAASAILLSLIFIFTGLACNRSDREKESVYLVEELPYAQQTAFGTQEVPFYKSPSKQNAKRPGVFIQSDFGSISFFVALQQDPELNFTLRSLAGNETFPGATVTIECDFPKPQRQHHRVAVNQPVTLKLHEFHDRIVKITFSIKASQEPFPKQAFEWIDPAVVQQNTRKGVPADAYKEFRLRHRGDNVLIFLFDAVNVSHVSAYGYSKKTTPFIDSVASDGIVWDNAFTPAVYTIASTGSLFTGLHPMQHGVLLHGDVLPDIFTTMAELFQQAGYETGLFSATGYASPVFGFGQGFRTVWIPKSPVIHANEFLPVLTDWLKVSKNRPFFGYVHFREPHFPFQPPPELLARFETDLNFQLPITNNSILRSEEEKRKIAAAYDANLAFVDQQFGKILEYLRSSGLYDRTILVLLSDHGEAFWEHGMQGHNSSLYEEMIRIPLVIRIPNEPELKAIRKHQLVENTFLYSTFIDLFGFSQKLTRAQDNSLLPLLLENRKGSKPMLFSQTAGRGSFGIRTSRFKFIDRRPDRYQDEFYDLLSDPTERNNRVEKYPVLAGYYKSVLQKQLREWEKSKSLLESVKKKAIIDKETEEQLRALGYIN